MIDRNLCHLYPWVSPSYGRLGEKDAGRKMAGDALSPEIWRSVCVFRKHRYILSFLPFLSLSGDSRRLNYPSAAYSLLLVFFSFFF